MNEAPISYYKRRCPAMILAEVDDPESQEGKDFCIDQCPYPDKCIVLECDVRELILAERVRIAKQLRARGVVMDDICLILDTSRRTIQRYLRR